MTNYPINDSHFRVEVLAKTERPNLVSYLAMHQDYCEHDTFSDLGRLQQLSDSELGERLVRKCIKYSHWGVCYDQNTEVLTDKGFKFWENVTDQDLLYAVNPDTGDGHFEKPSHLIKLDYNGDMISIEHPRLNLLITPDHRLFVKTRKKNGTYNNLHAKSAKEMYERQFKMSCETYLNSSSRQLAPFTSEQLAIIGFWIGDGVTSPNKIKKRIAFHIRVPRKVDYLKSLGCIDGGKEYYYYENNELANYLHTRCLDGDGNKILPDELLNIPYEQFLYLSDGLSQSDGSHRKSRLQYDYATSHKSLADKLYLLYILNGLSVKVYIEKHSTKNDNWRDSYRLRLHSKSEFRIEKYHQKKVDYNGKVYCAKVSTGALLVRRNGLSVISGNCEHPSITLNVIGFPHSVMVQARTHRIGVSFDCQSQRYTSQRFVDVFNNININRIDYDYEGNKYLSPFDADLDGDDIEKLFYIRPQGYYLDRKGKKYEFTKSDRKRHLERTFTIVGNYVQDIERGFAEEHARDLLPQNIRQDFVVTFNARSLLHFCDLRIPKDAQPEIRTMALMVFEKFKEWMPEVAEWYEQKRFGKNKLAP